MKDDKSSNLAIAQADLTRDTEAYRKAQIAFKKAEQNLVDTQAAYLNSRAAFKRAYDDMISKSFVQDIDTL